MTDYAIVVLARLSQDRPGAVPRSAHYLAEKTGVSAPTVAKVLKLLSRGGLVFATRGAAGGYSLHKRAGEISIADIIAAMEGPIALVSCVEGGSDDCGIVSSCAVRGNWARVNDAVKAALARVTLQDMAASPFHVIQQSACGGKNACNG